MSDHAVWTHILQRFRAYRLYLARLAIIDTLVTQHIQQLARDGIIHRLQATKVRQGLLGVFNVEDTGADRSGQDGELLIEASLVFVVCGISWSGWVAHFP
jgi:hypothetical protein